MATTILLRRGTSVQWAAYNTVLRSGEAAIESDTGKIKVGDGLTPWNALEYFPRDIKAPQLSGSSITTSKLSPGIILDGGGPVGVEVSPEDGGGGGGGGTVAEWPSGVFIVTDYGATGDGVTDDSDAIEECIAAAGRGSLVFFPRGHYLVSRPVVPMRQQTLAGVYATKYQAGEWPSFWADCAIIASSDFVGGGVIAAAPNSYGVHVEKLAIIGPGHDHFDSNVAGIRFPSRATNQGEMAWVMRDILVNSCPGPGVTGHMWVADFRDVHISNCGWGIRTYDNDGCNDTRVIGCNIYFNRHGGICFEGGYAGAINIIGCRIERSGNKYGYPLEPLDPAAPGMRFRRAVKVMITSCDTDSNTGHGLDIGNPDAFVYGYTITGCQFHRDGSGTQQDWRWMAWQAVEVDGATEWQFIEVPEGTEGAEKINNDPFAGVNLSDCRVVRMTGCSVTYGAPDDGQDVGPISPLYGIRLNEAQDIEITTTSISTLPPENVIRDEGNNNNIALSFPRLQMMTVPVAGEARWLPEAGGIGSIAYQNDLATLVVKDYSGNWRAMLSYSAANPQIRLPRTVDLRSDDDVGDAVIRIVRGGDDTPVDYPTLRWQFGSNAGQYGHTWYLGRYVWSDELGYEEYIDSPIAVNYTSGRVDTNHQYIRNESVNEHAVLIRGALDQTQDIQRWQAEVTVDPVTETTDLSSVAGVRTDGRVWGSEAVASNDFVTLSQLSSGGAATQMTLSNTTGSGLVRYEIDSILRWAVGHNPQANGNTFYIGRFDELGDYTDDPVAINLTTGRVDLNYTYIRSAASAAPALVVRGAEDSTALLQEWVYNDSINGLDTVAGVRSDGRVFGTDGTADADFVTKAQLDAAGGGGGTSWTNSITLEGDGTQYTEVVFESAAEKKWELGVNPDANSNNFYIDRYQAGAYVSTPLAIVRSTGQVNMKRVYVEADAASTIPLAVRAAASPTVSMFRVENNAGSAQFEVLWDGTVRSKWGSSSFAVVQQGCTQIVREGASPGNTMLGVYTSTANAAADSSVFEVYGNGEVKCAPATWDGGAMTLGQLKAVVAASSDFADFQSRVAAL